MDHLQNVMGYFDQQQPLCAEHDRISKDLYKEFGVKAGLRDENGKGVLAGLTNISDIRAFQYVDGVKKPADGQLLYRGYDVKDLIRGSSGSRFAFEEAGYLLLFGELPTQEKLEEFCRVLGECRTMPTNFTRDVIMKAPSHDIMNSMARSVLTLASYDPKAGDLEISNVLRQSIQLAGIFPMLAVYSYHAYNHYEKDGSMYIHRPDPELSTAENFLRMLRPDMKYTELEARVLDVALLLHAEHGGGNNSTFTTRVVTSSGTDTYSAMAAALCSLKGPRHGGANLMVMQMMQNIRENLRDQEDDEELETYLKKLLHGEAFDRKGLIYGMGHAVYSLSDPRANLLHSFVEKLSREKGRTEEYELYSLVERLGPEIIAGERRWRAAKLAGITDVPVLIREYDKQQTMEIALIENVQRADLNPIEEAQAFQQLIQEFHLTQEEIANRVSKNRATITNSMRLLKLDVRVQDMLADGKISSGHARALLGLEEGERQYQVAVKINEEKLSVRDVEKLVKMMNRPPKEKKPEKGPDIDLIYRQVEDKLKSIMGTKVVINQKDKNKGRIEIEYYSQEELERLIELMESLRA